MILFSFFFFFFNDPAPTEISPLPLHAALPIYKKKNEVGGITADLQTCTAPPRAIMVGAPQRPRSEEHTSELQSQSNLVCRLLLEKKKRQPHRAPSLAHRYPFPSQCTRHERSRH